MAQLHGLHMLGVEVAWLVVYDTGSLEVILQQCHLKYLSGSCA